MLEEQGGVCAICGTGNGQKMLHVDHDHGTGRVRGLLCHQCNRVLGLAHDNPELMRKAIEYLSHGVLSTPNDGKRA